MSEMARYIDADKIVFWIRYVSSNGMLCDTDVRKVAFSDEIARIPTADVAPRAEVAREIFEEIRDLIHFTMEPNSTTLYAKIEFEKLEALKKKYTQPEPPEGE